MMKAGKKSKRWISVLLCVLMMVPMLVLPAGAVSVDDFTDVPSGAWYYDAVKYSVDKGIFAGMSDSTFEPQTALTRGMFVQTMANLSQNFESETVTKNYFTDITSGAWYEKAANWAYYKNLISGTADYTFSATVNITREQAATILYSYAMRSGGATDLKDPENALSNFTDFNSISSYAIVPMIWAVEKGVMMGVAENTLDPKGTLTRAQAAQLFTNIEGIIDDDPFVYTWDYAEDLGHDYENTIGMTYAQLVENLGEPVTSESDEYYRYYTFEAYPGIYYDFDLENGFDTEADKPLDDTTPALLETTIDYVMPDIVGMTYGEATKYTNGTLYIFYDSQYYPTYISIAGWYVTNNYSYRFTFNESGPISNQSIVYIYAN